MRVRMRPERIKRGRRCLNPQCPTHVAGGRIILRSTWTGEFARLRCPRCGAISVFNPIGAVRADNHRHTYVGREGSKAVEHIFPQSAVVLPEGIYTGL